MIIQPKHGVHSAHVEMALLLNGQTLHVAQMGPDFVILAECKQAAAHPPGEAELVLRVDDVEDRWRVWLPNGISPTADRIMLERPPTGT